MNSEKTNDKAGGSNMLDIAINCLIYVGGFVLTPIGTMLGILMIIDIIKDWIHQR